jgi:hypothetical protein
MKIKVLTATFLMMLAITPPVLAQGQGNGNGNSGQSEGGNNGNGNGNNGNGNGGNGNGGNNGPADTPGGNRSREDVDSDANPGKSHGGANHDNGANGPPSKDSSPPAEPVIIPEDELLPMVEAGEAVSLVSLLPDIKTRTGGQIIDAQLVRAERSLVYVVKVLTPAGRVGTEYYNARSGSHIEVP